MVDNTESWIDSVSAEWAAKQVCKGFNYHDSRDRNSAENCFYNVDLVCFNDRNKQVVKEAAWAYTEALWQKDKLEEECSKGGETDYEKLANIDWDPVYDVFEYRCELLDIDIVYAEQMTLGWKRHKIGGDYWTPHMKAVHAEVQSILGEEYPDKPHEGLSGFGPLPARYLLGVELHDMRCIERAIPVMAGYYDTIVEHHRTTEGE